MTENRRIDCTQCRHYHITWDPNFPKGCRSFGFKSRSMPSVEVLRASGQPCNAFDTKSMKKDHRP